MYKKFSMRLLGLTIIVSLLLGVIHVQAAVDNRIGSVMWSDIKGYINGSPIPTYNIDGYLYIQASDLRGYGFNVDWDATGRRALVTFKDGKVTAPLTTKASSGIGQAGSIAYGFYQTDIKSYVSGSQVQTYNISGRMMIPFNSLGVYGTCVYNAANRTSTVSTIGSSVSTNTITTTAGNINFSNAKASIDGFRIPVYSLVTKSKVATQTVNDALVEAQQILQRFDGQPESFIYTAPNGITYDRIAAQDLVNSLNGGSASPESYIENIQEVVLLEDLAGYGIRAEKIGSSYVLSVVGKVNSPKQVVANAGQVYSTYYLPGVKAVIGAIPATVYQLANGKYVIPFTDLAPLGTLGTPMPQDNNMSTQGSSEVSSGVTNLQIHYTVSGEVKFTDDSSVAKNAAVKLYDQFNNLKATTSTDETGKYEFVDVVAGGYLVKVSVNSSDASSDIFVVQSGNVKQDVSLVQVKSGVTVLVKTTKDAALSGADVSLQGDGPVITAKSDASGRVDFSNIPAGTYKLSVTLAGYDTSDTTLTVAKNSVTQNIALRKRGFVVSGRVTSLGWGYSGSNSDVAYWLQQYYMSQNIPPNQAQNTYGNFRVTLTPLASTGTNIVGSPDSKQNPYGEPLMSEVDSSGKFSIEGVSAGWYRLEVSGWGYENYSVPSLPIFYDTSNIVCTMTVPSNLVTGTVSKSDGSPVSNARVDIREGGPDGEIVRTVYTDAYGKYSFDAGVVGGSYYVQIVYGSDVYVDDKPVIVSDAGVLTSGNEIKSVLIKSTATVKFNTFVSAPVAPNTYTNYKLKLVSSSYQNEREIPAATDYTWSDLAMGSYTAYLSIPLSSGGEIQFTPVTFDITHNGLTSVSGFKQLPASNTIHITASLDYTAIPNALIRIINVNTGVSATYYMSSGKLDIKDLANDTYTIEILDLDVEASGKEPKTVTLNYSDININWLIMTDKYVSAKGTIEGVPSEGVTNVSVKLTGKEYKTVPLVVPYEAFRIESLPAGNYEAVATVSVKGTTMTSNTVAFTVREGQTATIPPIMFESTYTIIVSAVLDDKPLNGGTVKVTPITAGGGMPSGTSFVVPIASGNASINVTENGWYRLELNGLGVKVTGNDAVDVEIFYGDKRNLWYLYTTQEQSVTGIISGANFETADVITKFTVSASGNGTISRSDVASPYDTFDLGELSPGTYNIQGSVVVNGKTILSDVVPITVKAGASVPKVPLSFDFRFDFSVSVYANGTPISQQAQIMITKLQPDGIQPDPSFDRNDLVFFTSAGKYTFTGLPNGKYKIYFNPSAIGMFATPPSPVIVDINYSGMSYVWNVTIKQTP